MTGEWYDDRHRTREEALHTATQLRLLADYYEQGAFGCLTLETIGRAFGREFYELIFPLTLELLQRNFRDSRLP